MVHRGAGHRGLVVRTAGGQARHPALRHRSALPRRRGGARGEPGRRRRGPRPGPGATGLRVHPADGCRFRPRRWLGGAGPGHPLLHPTRPGRRSAQRETGLHAQAGRPARRASRGCPRRRGGDRHPDRRRRGGGRCPQHRGGHRQVPRHGGRGGCRGRSGPGARRVRIHASLHRREDPSRRQDHHDLRRHLGDPGDDHRPRPLAAAPEDPGGPTTSTSPQASASCTVPIPPSEPTRARSPWNASPGSWRRAASGD